MKSRTRTWFKEFPAKIQSLQEMVFLWVAIANIKKDAFRVQTEQNRPLRPINISVGPEFKVKRREND